MTDVERSVLPTAVDADVEANVTTTSESRSNSSNDAEPQSKRRDTLLQRLQSLKEGVTEPQDCFDKLYTICCGSASCDILTAVSYGVLIAMVAMGSVYVKECPVERYIPIYLIVGGCFGLLQNTISSVFRLVSALKKNDNSSQSPAFGLLYLFLFAWYIAGSAWVYRVYGHFTTADPAADDYCHPAVYWFTFALITSGYVFSGLMVVAGIVAICYVQCS